MVSTTELVVPRFEIHINFLEDKTMSNNLNLTKGLISRNGSVEPTVIGGIKVFLQNAYNANSPLSTRTVDTANGQRTVTTVNASLKTDETMCKQLKYFFGQDVPEGQFVAFRITLWGRPGENLSRFNPKNGDLYLFFVSDMRVNEFTRKNGTPGFALEATAFAFEPAGNGKKGDGSANKAPDNKPAQKAASPSASSYPAQTEYDNDDFAAVEDSDYLPF